MEKMITSPMLAGKAPTDLSQLKFPLLASQKLDGIRCLMINGKAVTRTFKPLPNDYIRQTLEMTCNSMILDGEILVRNRTFNELSGDVRRSDGRPDFFYAVFDVISSSGAGGLSQTYDMRMKALGQLLLPACCQKILPVEVKDLKELQAFEEKCIAEGYEGAMVRSPQGGYKCGRSTTNDGLLLKIKRFEDSEATVIGYEEMMENQNFAAKDAFGRTKRSTNAENLVPKGTLGQLTCRLANGVEFGLGTGYDQATRDALWAQRDKLIGKVVVFKHQASGADARPRFPVWKGFRNAWDYGE